MTFSGISRTPYISRNVWEDIKLCITLELALTLAAVSEKTGVLANSNAPSYKQRKTAKYIVSWY